MEAEASQEMRPISIYQRSDMLRAMKEARRRMGCTGEAMDDMVGLTRGHVVKIENGDKPWGRLTFTITSSLAWFIEAAGMRLLLVSQWLARKLTGPEYKSFTDQYTVKDGATARRIPSVRVIYRWTPETSSPLLN